MKKAPRCFGYLWLLLAFFPLEAWAQDSTPPPPEDAAAARAYLEKARIALDSTQYLSAELFAEHAYNFFKKTPQSDPEDLAQSAYLTGLSAFHSQKYGGARPFFEEAAQIWTQRLPAGDLAIANALHYTAICLYQRDRLDQALERCEQAYQMRVRLLPSEHQDLAESLRWIGNVYVELGKYLKAIEYYDKALSMEKAVSGEKSARVAVVLGNMGYAWGLQGNFQKSITVQEQALQIRQELLPADHLDLAYSFHSLGMAFKSLRKNEEALEYFKQALSIRRKHLWEFDSDIANTVSEMGQAYFGLKDYSNALAYFEQANQIMVQSNGTDQAAYGYVCADLGQVNLKLKQYPEAVEWHKKNVAFKRRLTQNPNSPLASSLVQLGVAQLANDDFEAAKADFQEAKQLWETLFGPQNKNGARADAGLANTYQKWYLKTGDEKLLEQARTHYRLAEMAIEASLREELFPDAQKKILADASIVFEKAINAELLFLKKQPDNAEALEKAWQLSESMHSFLLFSATQEANARHFAGIPDEELSRDSLLRTQITALEKKRRALIEHKGLKLTDSLVLAVNLQISAQKEAQQQLQTLFETNYPDYFKLKYQRQTVSLEQTQQRLTANQTLLEYCTGDSSIYVFVLQKEGSKVLVLPRDFPLVDWVQSLREGISNYHTAKQKTPQLYEKTVRQYAEMAHNLYQKLIAPIANELKPELIIVPGEGFANLPFEALLSAPPKTPANFNTYPFLLQKHVVQYAYSATMLQQMSARKHPKPAMRGLLAFAPFFEADTASLSMRLMQNETFRQGFSPLPYSGEEVLRVKKRYAKPCEVWLGATATKQKFQELASGFKILHLATHGKANHQDGEFSFLAFSIEDGSSLLSVAELYNLSLNADLVVLSACETGIGAQQRGEGVISLARAFAFAGAKSIVASLWSVNDKSTMEIMDQFYVGMKTGLSKPQALAQAKLDYLSKNPGQNAHPFFWAGFVGVGDMEGIKF